MTPISDLETLLRRHLPRDENRAITDQVVAQWKRSIATAETAVVAPVHTYGPKLQASWLDHQGYTVASIARPFTKADSIWDFIFDWAKLMREQELPSRVIWHDEGPAQSSLSPRSQVVYDMLKAIAEGTPFEIVIEDGEKPSRIRDRIRRAAQSLGMEGPVIREKGDRMILT